MLCCYSCFFILVQASPFNLQAPCVQIGTGAGIGIIVDFYMFMTANDIELSQPVTVYFSTNSIGLFQFVTDLVCARSIPNYSVNAHLTSAKDFDCDFEAQEVQQSAEAGAEHEMKLGRLSFMEVLSNASKDADVYFCGSPGLQWKVEKAAAMYGLKFHPGHRFTGDGGISCHRTGPASFVCRCSAFPCCLSLN